jgi:hypothetical protein
MADPKHNPRPRISPQSPRAANLGDAQSLPEPLSFERRIAPRRPAESAVTAYFTAERHRFGIARLELIDTSPSGLGGRTRTHLETGARVMVCPPGVPAGWKSGLVVRSTERDGWCHVGVRFEQRLAA